MKARILILAGTLLLAPAALADDHHFQAITSGALTFDIELGAAVNKADHVLPDSPGQASPFTGNHQCTPATDTEAAHHEHNVQPKGPEAGDCTEEEEE
jgi:hypothetical protein